MNTATVRLLSIVVVVVVYLTLVRETAGHHFLLRAVVGVMVAGQVAITVVVLLVKLSDGDHMVAFAVPALLAFYLQNLALIILQLL